MTRAARAAHGRSLIDPEREMTRGRFRHYGAALSRIVAGVLLTLVVLATTPLPAQRRTTIPFRAGMVITRSTKITPGTYRLPGRSDDSALIKIRGENIRVDLRGVILEGQRPSHDPDLATGTAILVEGGPLLTIEGGRIRGYKTGIRVVGATRVNILGVDLSDNWRPRLFSLVEHESLIDWLSFHHNENGEWRRFGAGIVLEDVHGAMIAGNRVRHGMNGLLLTRSDSIMVLRNDFSFNSGLGIGLYRSTRNSIMHNRVDYNVRGFSRFYRRGQDSADLLMFEQSSENYVAFNSMTHGGDGLFLWAGQTTMDTGEGGSNGNTFFVNDFSWAPTNGMEATFSRNAFVGNRVIGNDHGLWGGYSYSSDIVANCFAQNRVGIAIEHGQDNTITGNAFTRDSTAIQLWAEPIAPSDWGYPKRHDTRSRDWRLSGNRFRDHRVGLRVRQTEGFTESGDSFLDVDSLAVMRDTSRVTLEHRIDQAGPAVEPCNVMPQLPPEWERRDPAPIASYFSTPLTRRDRSAIIIDEWGPYDWSTPKLWPVDSSRSTPLALRVLGPDGRWRVSSLRGIRSLSRRQGTIGDTIIVTPYPDSAGTWRLELKDGAGHRFAYERFEPIPGWDVRYLRWSDSTAWSAEPFLSRREPRLDKMWYRPPAEIPQANWALEATSNVELPGGVYTLRTISDDAIQIWIDGHLAIDHSDPHESLVDNVPIPPGRHELKVRYRQVEGWMELRVEIVRGRVSSLGSPGPH